MYYHPHHPPSYLVSKEDIPLKVTAQVQGICGYDGSKMGIVDEDHLVYAVGNGVKVINLATSLHSTLWREDGAGGVSALCVNHMSR